MSDENTTAASGEQAGSSKTQTQGAATLADLSPELQAELTKLMTRKEKEWEKKHSDVFAKASDYEKLQQQLKQKQESELSELEKTKRDLNDTLPFKDRAIKLEASLQKYLEAEIESIPEENRSLIPKGYSVEEQLEYISENRERLKPQSKNPQGPTVKTLTAGTPDKLMAEAEERVARYYPREVVGSESWKAKVSRVYEQLKALVQHER